MNSAGWLQFLKSQTNQEGFVLDGVVYWGIWWHRIRIVHGSTKNWGQDIIEWANRFLASYRATQLPSTIKVNFDVGYFGFDFYLVAAVDSDKAGVCRGWRVRRFYEV